MAAADDSSELSSLSSLSPAPSDDEIEKSLATGPKSKKGILNYFPKVSELPPKEPSPPPRKRSPSPPHEYVLADNADIAFIVMFRSRFNDAFPKSLAHFGPQDIERDVVQTLPGDRAEHFLCAVLGLLLNRKQDVKPGHYGRALEDAIASHKNQWASSWDGKSPLSGGKTFNSMDPTERLTLLKTLVLWSLSSSDTVKGLINQSYKQNRHEDDMNQPRSVQPWGTDGDRRRYFLIEGQDDTAFRVYRESNFSGAQRTWWSVAGSIEELQSLAEKLETKDGGPKARKFAQKIRAALPRFEAGEDKRKRREYRQLQKERFKRPEVGFSSYEGRTRGKRIKYTYSDDEDIFLSDSTANRRSARNTGTNTPAETGPVTTASGRQIRAPTRLNNTAGEGSAPNSVKGDTPEFDKENSLAQGGRPKRSAAIHHGHNGWAASGSRRVRGETDEDESEAFGDDEDDVDAHVPEESDDDDDFDEDEAMVDDDFDEDEAMVDDDLDEQPQSLLIKLSVTPPKLRTALDPLDENQKTNGQVVPRLDLNSNTPKSVQIEMKDALDQAPLQDEIDVKAAAPSETITITQKSAPTQPILESAATKQPEPAPPTTSLAFRGSP